jgi:hypothetical protein
MLQFRSTRAISCETMALSIPAAAKTADVCGAGSIHWMDWAQECRGATLWLELRRPTALAFA